MDLKITLEEMISNLDKSIGMLLVSSMNNPTIKQAMDMITDVSLALGEVENIEFYNYDEIE